MQGTMRDVLRQQAGKQSRGKEKSEYGVRDGLPGKTKRRGGEGIDFPHPVTIPPAKRKYHWVFPVAPQTTPLAQKNFFLKKKKKKNIRFETYVRDGKSREENKKTLRNDVC